MAGARSAGPGAIVVDPSPQFHATDPGVTVTSYSRNSVYPPTTVVVSACDATGATGTVESVQAQVGMCTKVRDVAEPPGSMSTCPTVQAFVSAATRFAPVGNGGRSSTPVGGSGGGALPARYGALNTNIAPWQLPPKGATGCASCQVPRVYRNAVTAIRWPATFAAVASAPGAVSVATPPGGIAPAIA